MAKINTLNYQTVAAWNGSQDLFVVEQPDGTKVATPAMVKQFIEAGDFEATGEVKDGHGNKLADMAKANEVKGIAENGNFTATGRVEDGDGNKLSDLVKKAEKNPSNFSDYTSQGLYAAAQSMTMTDLKGGYKVKDGICYINMQISFTGSFNTPGAWNFVGGFPKPAFNGVPIIATPTNNDANSVALVGGRVNDQGSLYIINSNVVTGGNSTAFTFIGSYPIANS